MFYYVNLIYQKQFQDFRSEYIRDKTCYMYSVKLLF